MSGNRDYRNDPPSHQRLAARQASADRKRSPKYSSARNNHEHTPSQYPLDEYPQSRRVFTTDRNHLQDHRREYNEKHPRQERQPPNYYQRHSPKQRDIIDPRRQRSVSPRHSETQVREDRWYNDHRNIGTPGQRLSPRIVTRKGTTGMRKDEFRLITIKPGDLCIEKTAICDQNTVKMNMLEPQILGKGQNATQTIT